VWSEALGSHPTNPPPPPPLPHLKKICPNSTFKKPPNAHPLFPPKESPNLSV